MANITVKRKTLILTESESNGEFVYNSGEKDIYINSTIFRKPNNVSTGHSNSEQDTGATDPKDQNPKTVHSINGCYVVYFSSGSKAVISTKPKDSSNYTTYTYDPVDSQDSVLKKHMGYKRLDMMIDDDTSYSILRVNPKLTGNVKVVVDSDSNMYLDTFKVSLGLSQNKYRHIPINPSEYYGRTLMAKMKSIPTDDFYKIEDSCYDLFATANDLDDQYYDKYNYGVRTNRDKMYSENYSLLAPLCIRKVLPDFFLVFKINDYESLFDSSNGTEIKIGDRTKFIDLNNCELIKSFDFRDGTTLGTYVRTILDHNKNFVGDIYACSDYDHFNIFNGISVERGVVSNIYEETTQERSVNNQVAMNDWYTLGFQRNHIVSKDIINFEFMFDDTSEKMFSLPTYFGVYVRLNGEDETFTCVGTDSNNNAIFDSSIHGIGFEPSKYPTVIYGMSTDNDFIRLKDNVIKSKESKSHKLEAYKSIVTVDTYDISEYNDGTWSYVSNKLNDVLDPGEHYRVIDETNHVIYEVIASNFFTDYELSDISYTQDDINSETYRILRVSVLNTEYRSNIDEDEKSDTIKKQLNLIVKAFNMLSEDINAYNDGKSSFSLLYNKKSTKAQKIIFEKVSSICGFNKANDDIIRNQNYNDKSSYIFGCESIDKIIINPSQLSVNNSALKLYYPIGFENLGTRVVYCSEFMDIVSEENRETMILVNDDIQKRISPYKTVLYTTRFNENKIYNKNIALKYISYEDGIMSTKQTNPMYSITGFGDKESYLIKFEITPLVKSNGKVQFYQNFPMNAGVCSIFPLKDYYFDVLDQKSVFFIKNENNPNENIRIGGNKSEYSTYDQNAYQKAIIKPDKSEEFISDYCDKFRSYNIDSSGLGYMSLDSENELGLFLSNMQKNGHNKFDVSLISPYCCKWRMLGTDMTGNRMRVMYNLRNTGIKHYTYDSSTWADGIIDKDGSIKASPNHKTSPYINISNYKDIRVNESMKPYIDYVGYYTNSTAKPVIEWYWQYSPFKEFNKDLLGKSSYIRVSVNTIIDYDEILISLYNDSNNPYLIEDASSYWIPSDDTNHIGYLSYKLNDGDSNSVFTKYVSDLYDEDETDSFNKYICLENGSIDDILYRNENDVNKFSKIYKYGDNSIEFLSCGVKIRIKSSDKSTINLSRYVGYSVILLSMSGNNANQPGTYELFVDETKEQAALIVYNGIYSENNKINYTKNEPGIYRVKHSSKISDSKYDGDNNVKISDDGFIFDSSVGVVGSKMLIVSKPTDNGVIEIIDNDQIVLSGDITDINGGTITIANAVCAINGNISTVDSQTKLNSLLNANNNVDAYIITTGETGIATHSLTLKNLKDLTSSYAITVKTENETKKYNDISSILSISIVDPFDANKENEKYELTTNGYIHPSYAVPVMNDVFEFEYKALNDISDNFKTLFDGCNIMLSDISKISQTWMKKVIDIDNIMKQEDTKYNKNVSQVVRYKLTSVPVSGTYINSTTVGSKYKEKLGESYSNFSFIVESFTPDETEKKESTVSTCVIADRELLVDPVNTYTGGITYHKWKSSKHTIEYNKNYSKDDVNLVFDYNTNTYTGNIVVNNIDDGGSGPLKEGETLYYESKVLIGVIDETSNVDVIKGLTYNSKIYGKILGANPYTHEFFYDGTYVDKTTKKLMLSLRTDTDITFGTSMLSFYFSTKQNAFPSECIRFKESASFYTEDKQNGKSNLLHFTIKSISEITTTKYTKAELEIRCDAPNAKLYELSGTLHGINDSDPDIKYENAVKTTDGKETVTISKFVDQSSSVTLFRDNDPLIGYWYTNMCRLFSKYDTYISYYGAFSGFEKNNYIASRGINLKTKDPNGDIIHSIELTTWVDYNVYQDESKIVLNITSSIINFINSDNSNGYSHAWNKNQQYINNENVSYSSYKTKYIENTILKIIDINNSTKFRLYADKSTDTLEFKFEKPSDTSKYEEMKNLENNLVFFENRYYMNINNLEPHSYYAEMIITF